MGTKVSVMMCKNIFLKVIPTAEIPSVQNNKFS